MVPGVCSLDNWRADEREPVERVRRGDKNTKAGRKFVLSAEHGAIPPKSDILEYLTKYQTFALI